LYIENSDNSPLESFAFYEKKGRGLKRSPRTGAYPREGGCRAAANHKPRKTET